LEEEKIQSCLGMEWEGILEGSAQIQKIRRKICRVMMRDKFIVN
jgi:hypothetical protein